MSVLLTNEEAILLKALASGQVRLRIGRKQYLVKRFVRITSFGFTAELKRYGRISTQEVAFNQFEVNGSDLAQWLDANKQTLDEHMRRLWERAQPVRPQ